MRKPVADEEVEMAAIAGPLAVKILAFIRSDLPAPLQKHHDSPNTPIFPPRLSWFCFRSATGPRLYHISSGNDNARNGQHRKWWMD